jgi:pimeloyl-ACP methyl ester carboxylesterase
VPPLSIVMAAGLVTLIGLLADALASRLHVRPPWRPLLITGCLAIAAVWIFNPQFVSHSLHSMNDDIQAIDSVSSGLSVFPRSRFVFLGVSPTPFPMGERIELSTGGVAWYDRPAGDGPHPGVVFFHGSDPNGSRATVSIAVRRAAVDAGYAVLSLDHVGFGQSPGPDPKGDIAGWDPLPSVIAAVEWLTAMPDVSTVVVAGYAMGAADVLRVLPVYRGIDAAVLLGASAIPPVDYNRFWYESFNSDRKMTDHISPRQFDAIIERFYDQLGMAADLPPDHPPILFLNFEHELDIVLSRQDDLYAAVSGCKSARVFSDTTHNFDMADDFGVALGDARAVKQLSNQFRNLALFLSEAGARPARDFTGDDQAGCLGF